MPIAASSVPDETSTEQPASRPSPCEASTPSMPKAIVAMPPATRSSAPRPAECAAPAPKASEATRSTA